MSSWIILSLLIRFVATCLDQGLWFHSLQRSSRGAPPIMQGLKGVGAEKPIGIFLMILVEACNFEQAFDMSVYASSTHGLGCLSCTDFHLCVTFL